MRTRITFFLNGRRIEASGADVFLPLADFLRYERHLTGTKIVCAEGDCGACTVLRAFRPVGSKESLRFEPINACIALTAQMDGSHLVTIEGLAEGETLHPAQACVATQHGSQCGFCTPGFVMALAGMKERRGDRETSAQDVKNYLTGNLCRCTGYQPLVNAGVELATTKVPSLAKRYLTPVAIKQLEAATKGGVELRDGTKLYVAPTTLAELRRVRAKYPKSTLLSAGTDWGVALNKGRLEPGVLVSLHNVAELYRLEKKGSRLSVGARVSLTNLRRALPTSQARLRGWLDIFASPQIKNVATLAGNIANGSPIADTPPMLIALKGEVEIIGPRSAKSRRVPLDELYRGYRQLALKPGEIITKIHFDLPAATDRLSLKKVSRRRDLDISTVNAAFWMRLKKGRIEDLRLVLGGVGPTPLRLRATEALLKKQGLAARDLALKSLQKEITPLSDHRGTSAYRRLVSHKLLEDFLKETSA